MVDLRIGGQPGGGLLFLTTANLQPITLKAIKKYFLKFTNMHVYNLIRWNFINKKKGKSINLKKNQKTKEIYNY